MFDSHRGAEMQDCIQFYTTSCCNKNMFGSNPGPATDPGFPREIPAASSAGAAAQMAGVTGLAALQRWWSQLSSPGEVEEVQSSGDEGSEGGEEDMKCYARCYASVV